MGQETDLSPQKNHNEIYQGLIDEDNLERSFHRLNTNRDFDSSAVKFELKKIPTN